MAGISADGDPKVLAAMVYEVSLTKDMSFFVTQDIIHTVNKGRNRLLKKDIKLPMGNHTVSINHLQQLLRYVHKSVHGLSHSDVFPVDRMNYHSFQKITQDRVIRALQERITNSEGTVQYLLVFRDIANSFQQFDLKPLNRIHLIFRSLYFLRIWRKFIVNSSSYTLMDNFITHNTYTCVEINAKNLVSLVKKFRNRNTPEEFLPAFFDSQECEKLFRVFRSMGTTQFTKINFSLLELIHMVGRLEVENDIVYCKLSVEGVNLPHQRKEKTTIYELPSDDQIFDEIAIAKKEALQIARNLGMMVNESEIDEFQFTSRLQFNEDDENIDEDLYQEYENDLDMDMDIDIENIMENTWENIMENDEEHSNESMNNLNIDLSDEHMDECPDGLLATGSPINPNSPLVYVMDENGEQKIIPKSHLVWMITEPSTKMSNDRLKRFKRK